MRVAKCISPALCFVYVSVLKNEWLLKNRFGQVVQKLGTQILLFIQQRSIQYPFSY